MGDLTLEQLREYVGEGDSPVYIAVKGIIYDVTPAKNLYGPGNLCFPLPHVLLIHAHQLHIHLIVFAELLVLCVLFFLVTNLYWP